ncbi:ABC transporter substrate-binding protein [Paenalcaligenes sp. Me52]|uniref:ABC transporter substrate-binding protein n=1 Tax=Paenalcaligenes sp. Me52 TaxID=3392038 RepID=UPI003D2D76E4
MIKIAIATASLTLGLLGPAHVHADTPDHGLKNQTLSFAMTGAYPPFSFVNERGELTGFDIEIGNEVAKRLDVKAQPLTTAWDGIIAGLMADRYDTIIGSMAITPQRLEAIDFSEPYYRDGAQLFVKQGSGLQSIEDLKGKTIGVTLGTTFEDWLRQNVPEVEVRTYKGDPQIIMDVMTGRLSGFVTTRLTGLMAIKERNAPMEMAGDLLYQEEVGIAIKKGRPELQQAINTALQDMRDDGTYTQISEKYFGTDIR